MNITNITVTKTAEEKTENASYDTLPYFSITS